MISQGCVSVIQLVIVFLLLLNKYPDKLSEMVVLKWSNDTCVYPVQLCGMFLVVVYSFVSFFISSWKTNINVNCILRFSSSSLRFMCLGKQLVFIISA